VLFPAGVKCVLIELLAASLPLATSAFLVATGRAANAPWRLPASTSNLFHWLFDKAQQQQWARHRRGLGNPFGCRPYYEDASVLCASLARLTAPRTAVMRRPVELLERVGRVRTVWNWIPAFRVVAETQHLHHASHLLRVSPSALSRSIRLLEDHVGERLFERNGRTLRLNAAGEGFLAVVRDAMRGVDDGLSQLASRELVGPVLLMSASALTDAYLLSALRELSWAHPALIPHIHRFSRDETVHRILRGQLDVALFQEAAAPHPRLVEDQIGSVSNGVYCGPGHPLFHSTQVGLAEILEHPFAAVVAAETKIVQDGWPPEQPRRIGMYLPDFSLAYDVCKRGQMLAILPDVLVESRGWGDRLCRLATEIVRNTPLCTARRPSLSKVFPAEAVAYALRRAGQ